MNNAIASSWQGNNRFVCKKTRMTGPKEDLYFNLTCWGLLIIIPSLYAIFIGPILWRNDFQLLPIIQIPIYCVTVLMLLLT
jgi:hypothetical protein